MSPAAETLVCAIAHPPGWTKRSVLGIPGKLFDRNAGGQGWYKVRVEGRRRPLVWPAHYFGPYEPPPNKATFAPPRPAHLAILSALHLSDVVPRTAKEIAEAVGRKSVLGVLNVLCLRKGWVKRRGEARAATYELSPAGREACKSGETYARLYAEWAEKYPVAAQRLAAKEADPAWDKTVKRNRALPLGAR